MKRLIILLLTFSAVVVSSPAFGQAWAERMTRRVIQRADEKAKEKVEERVNRQVDKATDRALDSAERAAQKGVSEAERGLDAADDALNNGHSDSEPAQEQMSAAERRRAQAAGGGAGANTDNSAGGSTAGMATAEVAYAKSDFVAGDEIIFEDNVANEQMGEFPSQWDLIKGNAEIVEVDGVKAIQLDLDTEICPLMKDMSSYLPEKFTIEFDYYGGEKYDDVNGPAKLILKDENNSDIFTTCIQRNVSTHNSDIRFRTPNNEERRSNPVDGLVNLGGPGWHHFALSFNKRALKCYTNETRICALPNVKQPVKLVVQCTFRYKALYIRNIRIAQGAVPLYDRMMSDGKFITYGITFDVGKSTIKPESMGEINRIVTLMTENPDLKFSVEGHTDSTGNATTNQTLSEQRSAAIVAKLTELGIAKERLQSAGKGQNSPIADNSTDEGRAKNRRVEFVKL